MNSKYLNKILFVLGSLLLILSACQSEPAPKSSDNKENKEETDNRDLESLSVNELEVLILENDKDAAYRLGLMYDYGIGDVAQNFDQARLRYENARALGNYEGSVALGYMYLNGTGVEVDYEKAFDYFTEAVNNGVRDGQVGLGRLYLNDGFKDYDEKIAYNYFLAAAERKNLDAVYFKSYCKEKSLGTDEDLANALSGYLYVAQSESEDIKDQFAINSANTRLGFMYLDGEGVDADYDAAMDYFDVAAKNGFSMASYYMGLVYENGDDEHDSDYKKAFECYEEAAKNNYAPALNQIGYLYCKGLGVDVDYEQALYYQKLSAAQNYLPAIINLGYLYENGLGTNMNLDTALSYYKIAKNEGYEGADAAVLRVENLLKDGKRDRR